MSARGMDGISDTDLIRHTLQRKERGEKRFPEFREFIGRYESSVQRYILTKVNFNHSLAEEILQNAKLKFFRAGLRREYDNSPASYYRQVVKTCIIDARYKEKKHRHDPLDQVLPDGSERPRQFKVGPAQPDQLLSQKRKWQAVRPVLDEACRRLVTKNPKKLTAIRAVHLRFDEKWKVQDIASELGYKRPNTVTQVIGRTLKELLRVLKDMRRDGFPGTELLFEMVGKA